jgi:alpha-L-fucosidase
VLGNKKEFGPQNLVDGDRYSFWATGDSVTTPEAIITLGRTATFNVVRVRENIKLGQRIDAFELDCWRNGGWEKFAQATSIGACRLMRTTRDITTDRIRLRITAAAAAPALSDFGVFLEAA